MSHATPNPRRNVPARGGGIRSRVRLETVHVVSGSLAAIPTSAAEDRAPERAARSLPGVCGWGDVRDGRDRGRRSRRYWLVMDPSDLGVRNFAPTRTVLAAGAWQWMI